MLQLTLTTVSMHCMASACMDVTQLQPITLTDPNNNIENQVTTYQVEVSFISVHIQNDIHLFLIDTVQNKMVAPILICYKRNGQGLKYLIYKFLRKCYG